MGTEIIKQDRFNSIDDVVNLHIIDFHRCNGHWNNNFITAAQTVAPWLIGHGYTIIQHDMTIYPQRDDFPVWEHAGYHKRLARLYWNFFHANFKGNLKLHDMPDFSGTMILNGIPANFCGDIGEVSVSTFAVDVLPQMHEGDLWISIVGDRTHIIIEFLDDIGRNIQRHIEAQLGLPEVASKLDNLENPQQLRLF